MSHTYGRRLPDLSFRLGMLTVFDKDETGGGRVAVEADGEKDLVVEEEDTTRSKVEFSTRSLHQEEEEEEEVSTRSNVSLSR